MKKTRFGADHHATIFVTSKKQFMTVINQYPIILVVIGMSSFSQHNKVVNWPIQYTSAILIPP